MRSYIIVTPTYRHTSAGIVALYRLAYSLNKKGYTAFITSRIKNDEWDTPHYDDHTRDIDEKNCILVMPETTDYTTLTCKTKVRWVLYYPGVHGGPKSYHHNELIFAWKKEYYPTDNILCQPYILNEELFKDDKNYKREGGLIYWGKGRTNKLLKEAEGFTEITREYPEERKDLAELFKKSKVFYSYDWDSLIFVEAFLCGCETYIVKNDKPIRITNIDAFKESVKLGDRQLDNFIAKTQYIYRG